MSLPDSILLPSTYLGPVSYFAHIVSPGKTLLDLHEHYIKQTYRNRCRILTANGVLNLIIPVIKVNGNHTRVQDVVIDYSEKWQINHWRAIESAYNNAPFFLYYREELEPIYRKTFRLLAEFNSALLKTIMTVIGIEKEIAWAEAYVQAKAPDDADLRGGFSPKQQNSPVNFPAYSQVFSERSGFQPDLSIVDLLFNLGPDTKDYLLSIDLRRSNHSV